MYHHIIHIIISFYHTTRRFKTPPETYATAWPWPWPWRGLESSRGPGLDPLAVAVPPRSIPIARQDGHLGHEIVAQKCTKNMQKIYKIIHIYIILYIQIIYTNSGHEWPAMKFRSFDDWFSVLLQPYYDSLGPPLHSAAGVPRDVRSASFPMRTCANGPCPAVPPSENLAFSAVVHGLLLELDV